MSVSVSETIGKLLLEGYKMLADSCDVCCTVLMQDRRGRVICVNCESASMANSVQQDMVANGKHANGNRETSNEVTVAPMRNGALGTSANRISASTAAMSISSCEEVLTKEIHNAMTTLQSLSQLQHDVQGKLLYVRYIKECAETIKALKGIKNV